MADMYANLARQFTALGGALYNLRHDVDGNGAINFADWTRIRNRLGTALPAGSPAPAASPAAVDEALAGSDAVGATRVLVRRARHPGDSSSATPLAAARTPLRRPRALAPLDALFASPHRDILP
jgi:hypothetical protein